MFASRTLTEHLVRGVIGMGALSCAFIAATSSPWLLLILVPVALIALRGCPMCWIMGLIETVIAKVQGKSADGACVDGRCALKRTEPGA